METKVNLDFDFLTKKFIEENTGEKLTDEQWDLVVKEIEGRADNWLDNLLPDLYQDIAEGVYDE